MVTSIVFDHLPEKGRIPRAKKSGGLENKKSSTFCLTRSLFFNVLSCKKGREQPEDVIAACFGRPSKSNWRLRLTVLSYVTMESIQSNVLRRLMREVHSSARLFPLRTWGRARSNFGILPEDRRMSLTVDLEVWRGPAMSHTS
ncbi:hypothetical protein Y032_0009g709 [Ancylostoma ceylanicum]|uniref:Uncharacterized protein n=1 Tax=Ancylostoma ceylanicum TaxID=53326 RepID=A0A016VIF5_9BILA|nr:hypothetical protein Y032_0009g709 [Ancylostoma ceylanicum]